MPAGMTKEEYRQSRTNDDGEDGDDGDDGEDGEDGEDGDDGEDSEDGDEKVEDSEGDDSEEEPAPKVSSAKANRRGQAPTARQQSRSSSGDLRSRATRQKNLRLVIDKLKGNGEKGG